MANEVLFLRGPSTDYQSLMTRDEYTFYYLTDTKKLFIGEKELTTPEDVLAAIEQVATNTSQIQSLREEVAALVGGEEGETIDDIIDKHLDGYVKKQNGHSLIDNDPTGAIIKYGDDSSKHSAVAVNDGTKNIEAELYALDGDSRGSRVILNTQGAYYTKTNTVDFTANDELVVKKDLEVLKVSVDSGGEEYAKVYDIKQNGVSVGKINIPKDLVVANAEVKTLAGPDEKGHEAGTYIVLTIKNETENPELWINVGALVDIYKSATAPEKTKEIQVKVDNDSREISASLQDGAIGIGKLNSDLQTQITNTPVGTIETDRGTSGIWNDESGGQLIYLSSSNNIRANVSVNHGEADDTNVYVQLSATDKTSNKGARINLDGNKAYYTSGKADATFDEGDEIVVKRDLPTLTWGSFIGSGD